jgi:hypothetical protein
MPIHQVVIEKSLGGRTNRGTFNNSHYVRTAFDYDDPGMRVIAQELVEAEQVGHLDDVYFLNVHIKQVAENAFNRPNPKDFVTIEQDVRGLRVSALPPLPGEICLLVKREATSRRAGRLLYRYMLTKENVLVNPQSQYELVAPEDFQSGGIGADTLIEKLNAGVTGGELVLPDKAGFFVQTSREIVGHRLGGVTHRQVFQQQRSVDAAKAYAAQRELNEAARKVTRLRAQSPDGVAVGDVLQTIVQIASLAFTVWAALDPRLRAATKIPLALKGIGGFLE